MDKFILRMIYSGLSAVKIVIFRYNILYIVVFSKIQVAEHRDVFQSKSKKLMPVHEHCGLQQEQFMALCLHPLSCLHCC